MAVIACMMLGVDFGQSRALQVRHPLEQEC
jgi:hypothetical protein